MVTFTNIKNPLTKIIVPDDVCVGERYFIIDKDCLNLQYHMGDVYLAKDEWIMERN